ARTRTMVRDSALPRRRDALCGGADRPASHNLDAGIRMFIADHVQIPQSSQAIPMARPPIRAAATAVLAAVLAMVALVSPARAQEGERPFGFIDRLFSGSGRLSGDRNAPPAVVGERSAQMSGSDLLLRLDRLEAQLRQLTGNVEQLQYRNQQLEGLV